jgi:hypothetical protein
MVLRPLDSHHYMKTTTGLDPVIGGRSGEGIHCGADGQRLHVALTVTIHYVRYMKTITINVSEPVYAEFRAASRSMGRPTAELIREAMELYRQERLKPRRDLTGFRPRSAGRVLEDLGAHDDLLEDMLAGPL